MSKLVVLITVDTEKALEIAEAWQERGGASGVTIIDSHGLRGLKRQSQKLELPMFISMARVLDKIRAENQMIFSVVEDSQVDHLIDLANGTLDEVLQPDTGIMFVVNVERVIGLGNQIQDAD